MNGVLLRTAHTAFAIYAAGATWIDAEPGGTLADIFATSLPTAPGTFTAALPIVMNSNAPAITTSQITESAVPEPNSTRRKLR